MMIEDVYKYALNEINYPNVDKLNKDELKCLFNKLEKYECCENFYNEIAKVRHNGKTGFVDTNIDEIVLPKYNTAFDFYDGYARILNNGYFFVNTKGDEIKFFIEDNTLYKSVNDVKTNFIKMDTNKKYSIFENAEIINHSLEIKNLDLDSIFLNEETLNKCLEYVDIDFKIGEIEFDENGKTLRVGKEVKWGNL